MKKCDAYQEKVSAYIDNELADADASKLFYHLGECAECRTMLTSMLQLRSALAEAEFPGSKRTTRQSMWVRKFAISYPVAAVLAIMLLVSSFFVLQRMTQPPTIVEKTQTEYVYMTSFPPVYAVINSSNVITTN